MGQVESKVDNIEFKVKGVSDNVDDTANIATEAKTQVDKLSEMSVTKEEVVGMIPDALTVKMRGTSLIGANRHEAIAEQASVTQGCQRRTITFGQLPEYTKAKGLIASTGGTDNTVAKAATETNYRKGIAFYKGTRAWGLE